MKRFVHASLVLLTIGVVLLSACGSSPASPSMSGDYKTYATSSAAAAAPEMSEYAEDMSYEEAGVDAATGLLDLGQSPALANRKIIKNSYLTLETREFDQALAQLTETVEASGGYIESLSSDGHSLRHQGDYYMRNAQISARIPSDRLEGVVGQVGSLCNVVSRSDRVDDISETYFDSQARLKSLAVQEATLLDILEKSEKLEDVITLQQALAQVRYEIESITASLRRMDNQVSYSYLNIELGEVNILQTASPVPRTFTDEMAASFARSMSTISQSLRGMVLFLIEVLPVLIVWLILLAIPVLLIFLLARFLGKRSRAKHPRNPSTPVPPSAPISPSAPAPSNPNPYTMKKTPDETPDEAPDDNP